MSRMRVGRLLAAALAAASVSCGDAEMPTSAEPPRAEAAVLAARAGEQVRLHVYASSADGAPSAALIELRWDPEVARYAGGLDLPAALLGRGDASTVGVLRIAAVRQGESPADDVTYIGSFLLQLVGDAGSRTLVDVQVRQMIDAMGNDAAEPVASAPRAIEILK